MISSPSPSAEIEALCKASFEGDVSTVSSLLSKMSVQQKNGKNARSQTALYCAARSGHEEVVKLLLKEKGIDVNAQEEHGSTALHAASFGAHPHVLSLLLTCGCDINIKNHNVVNGEVVELTPFAEARGKACEVWNLFKTGGSKALQKAGYPTVENTRRPKSPPVPGTPGLSSSSKNLNLSSVSSPTKSLSSPHARPRPIQENTNTNTNTNIVEEVTPLSQLKLNNDDSEDEVSFTEISDEEKNLPVFWVRYGNSEPVSVTFDASLKVSDFIKCLLNDKNFKSLKDKGTVVLEVVRGGENKTQKLDLDRTLLDFAICEKDSVVIKLE